MRTNSVYDIHMATWVALPVSHQRGNSFVRGFAGVHHLIIYIYTVYDLCYHIIGRKETRKDAMLINAISKLAADFFSVYKQVWQCYETFLFGRVVTASNVFITTDISGFYLTQIKDR